jgi:acyl-CoA dehydrogenase
MDFEHSPKVKDFSQRLRAFMDEHVYPNEKLYHEQVRDPALRWKQPPIITELRRKAKAAGLWNLACPDPRYGAGLNNLEYGALAEIFGGVLWAPECFNCQPPDAGNIELLSHYANDEQKEKWLKPLLAGEIRSAYAMTEPAVASSDATNVQTSIRRDGDEYVINGHKWFITQAAYEETKFMIVMGKSDPDNPNVHLQQSQIIVPMGTPGLRIGRPLTTFGYDDNPIGHNEVFFENVRVPAGNMILGEGRGFEIAQGRLGPGRIHHCMRLIGCGQRAIETAARRVSTRIAFGKPLAEQGSVRETFGLLAAELEQARLLTLRAADKMDREGNKAARDLIAMAKIIVPTTVLKILDYAIQVHGGGGMTGDWFMAEAYTYARWMRIGDGPDQVHLAQLGKATIKKYAGTGAAK